MLTKHKSVSLLPRQQVGLDLLSVHTPSPLFHPVLDFEPSWRVEALYAAVQALLSPSLEASGGVYKDHA